MALLILQVQARAFQASLCSRDFSAGTPCPLIVTTARLAPSGGSSVSTARPYFRMRLRILISAELPFLTSKSAVPGVLLSLLRFDLGIYQLSFWFGGSILPEVESFDYIFFEKRRSRRPPAGAGDVRLGS